MEVFSIFFFNTSARYHILLDRSKKIPEYMLDYLQGLGWSRVEDEEGEEHQSVLGDHELGTAGFYPLLVESLLHVDLNLVREIVLLLFIFIEEHCKVHIMRYLIHSYINICIVCFNTVIWYFSIIFYYF